MTIVNKPDELSLSGNLNTFRIQSTDSVTFILKKGDEQLLYNKYQPGSDGYVDVDVRDIVTAALSFTMPGADALLEQDHICADFTAIIDSSPVTFRAIRAGVDRFSTTASLFLQANFLTWQPQAKKVTYYTPEFLTYYAISACTVKLKAYFTAEDGTVTNSTISLAELSAGKVYTLSLQYGLIAGKFNSLPSFYDVWVEDSNSTRLSYIQRYVATDILSEQEQWILFENSLGGVDTFRAYGQCDFSAEHTHNIAEIDESLQEYRVDTQRKYQKSTGYIDSYERKWLLDFFPSLSKYIHSGNALRKIVVVESSAEYVDKTNPNEYTFTYRYTDTRSYLSLSRVTTLPDNITIKVPDLGSFTVPPRLIEFPSLPLTEGALFPVQSAFDEKWSHASLGSVASYIINAISSGYDAQGGIGHTHNNIALLQALSVIDGYLRISGEKIHSGVADTIKNNTFSDLIQFLQGITVGDFIDSMTEGQGIGLFPNGSMQLSRLEVRDSMTIMSLIINELQGMASDFVFSDIGEVESVTLISEGTYKLVIRKQTDAESLKFKVNHICKQVVNSVPLGGTDYYTSWFRVLSTNANDNSINIVLYPNAEVPGGVNYPPVARYNVMRFGSSNVPATGETNTDAAHWTLSSREGRIQFLQNVFKPILEDYNYALTFGKLPNIKALEYLPVTTDDVGVVAKTGIFENIFHFDYNGDLVTNKVDRGAWSLAIAQSASPYRHINNDKVAADGTHHYTLLEQHVVSHLGCIWDCLIDGTTEEPQWNSASWQLSKGDTSYSMSLVSTKGRQFRVNAVNTELLATIYYGSIDITDKVMALTGMEIAWTRDSGDVPSDNTWKPTYVDGNKNKIKLTNDDMGKTWSAIRTVTFKCTIYIPDVAPISQSFYANV